MRIIDENQAVEEDGTIFSLLGISEDRAREVLTWLSTQGGEASFGELVISIAKSGFNDNEQSILMYQIGLIAGEAKAKEELHGMLSMGFVEEGELDSAPEIDESKEIGN